MGGPACGMPTPPRKKRRTLVAHAWSRAGALPLHVCAHIAEFLPVRDMKTVVAFSQTCKSLRGMINAWPAQRWDGTPWAGLDTRRVLHCSHHRVCEICGGRYVRGVKRFGVPVYAHRRCVAHATVDVYTLSEAACSRLQAAQAPIGFQLSHQGFWSVRYWNMKQPFLAPHEYAQGILALDLAECQRIGAGRPAIQASIPPHLHSVLQRVLTGVARRHAEEARRAILLARIAAMLRVQREADADRVRANQVHLANRCRMLDIALARNGLPALAHFREEPFTWWTVRQALGQFLHVRKTAAFSVREAVRRVRSVAAAVSGSRLPAPSARNSQPGVQPLAQSPP